MEINNTALLLDILYQIHLLEMLLEKETFEVNRARYKGMLEAFSYILNIMNER